MLLLLVRHGLTDLTASRLIGRLPGVDLNDRGREQAAEAATLMSTLPIAAIYSSPLERTMQTAGALADARGMEVVSLPGLLEVDYGEWAGQEYKVLQKTDLWKLVQQHPSRARFPAGEAVREAQARVVASIEELFTLHAAATVAAFSHADMIKLAVAHYVGIPLDLFQRTSVGPGSITALHVGKGNAMLVRLGATSSLDDLKPPPARRRKN
ncbi:MAG: histidine phosphatase family protein [Candidatus Dormibacteria bacterium]